LAAATILVRLKPTPKQQRGASQFDALSWAVAPIRRKDRIAGLFHGSSLGRACVELGAAAMMGLNENDERKRTNAAMLARVD
jgi:hypothetical protein